MVDLIDADFCSTASPTRVLKAGAGAELLERTVDEPDVVDSTLEAETVVYESVINCVEVSFNEEIGAFSATGLTEVDAIGSTGTTDDMIPSTGMTEDTIPSTGAIAGACGTRLDPSVPTGAGLYC